MLLKDFVTRMRTELGKFGVIGFVKTWAKELGAAARTVEHPFNAGLTQEAWAARTRQVLAARPQ